jgi:hypothetical protein
MRESLTSLTLRERSLAIRVAEVSGEMGEQFRILEERGVFAAYSAIFTDYVALLSEPDCADEALCRLVFLLWYTQVEPGCFSGLGQLPQSAVDRVLRELDQRIGLGTLPPDLEWQLPHYHSVADWVFSQTSGLNHLATWLRSADDSAWSAQIGTRTFSDQGALSGYWASMIRTPAP